MKLIVKRIIASCIAAALACSAIALDMPVKSIGGKKYFYYKIKKNESLYGISKAIGISTTDIVKYNPDAAGRLKKDKYLYFPYDDFAAEESAGDDETERITEQVVNDTVPPRISLILPFGLASDEKTRTNSLALDFYKGFLLAADTLKNREGKIDIYAIDSEEPGKTFENILADSAVINSSVIIVPDNIDDIRTAALAMNGKKTKVLNVFNVPDSLYLSEPSLIQGNIPQHAMYKLAVQGMMEQWPDAVPVVLRNIHGRNEKEAFVTYMTTAYNKKGIQPITIEYDGSLLSSNLEQIPLIAGSKYVFVSSSGSLVEFNKFAFVLKAFKDRVTAKAEGDYTVNPVEIGILGYPDWTVFRGDALDTMHRLNVCVYSRFFDDFNSFDVKCLNDAFSNWYGEEIMESVPSQALLGYDFGCYIIKNIHYHNGEFCPVSKDIFRGLQSAFYFESAGKGYCNDALYFINYGSDNAVNARVLCDYGN
ncbi:MAG: LysM peptidoglycan-binding domain-containing protein [Muribaculaceae bacterium]|nr:LysM peptidoglycan-binding domain-containing protein [Muribaculaceae bacterium]